MGLNSGSGSKFNVFGSTTLPWCTRQYLTICETVAGVQAGYLRDCDSLDSLPLQRGPGGTASGTAAVVTYTAQFLLISRGTDML